MSTDTTPRIEGFDLSAPPATPQEALAARLRTREILRDRFTLYERDAPLREVVRGRRDHRRQFA